jgi:hypothetical protein
MKVTKAKGPNTIWPARLASKVPEHDLACSLRIEGAVGDRQCVLTPSSVRDEEPKHLLFVSDAQRHKPTRTPPAERSCRSTST